MTQLSISDWQVLLAAILLLPVIGLALKLTGFKKTQSWLASIIPRKISTTRPENQQLETAHKIARMVSIAANHGPYRANCLRKSLAAWWLLQRKGIAADIRIGVNKESDTFNAHAWVEHRDHVLLDTADVDQRFATFDTPQIHDN